MQPCSKNRKPIAWLAVDALPAAQARELHTHIQDCPGCRHYLDEISNVTKSLAASKVPSEIQTSAPFHNRIVHALTAEAARSPWQQLTAWLSLKERPTPDRAAQGVPRTRNHAQESCTSGRSTKSGFGFRISDFGLPSDFGFRISALLHSLSIFPNWRLALPIVIVIVIVCGTLTGLRRPPDAVPAPNRTADLPPTLSNYQMAADRSPEALDELLATQARKNPAPAPLYTVSTRSTFDVAD
jgi:hypothetical protein